MRRGFSEQRLYDKLRSANKPIVLNMPPVSGFTALGEGWPQGSPSSRERSLMPIYGNVVRFRRDGDKLRTFPAYFERYLPEGLQIEPGKHYRIRRADLHTNAFEVSPTSGNRTTAVRPFTHTEDQYIAFRLLQDALKGKTIALNTELLALPYEPFYTQKTDDVLELMMHDSDNFLAEQLLLMVSSGLLDNQISDRLVIPKLVKDHFQGFGDDPVWVDGSGLSRNNRISPRFFVGLLTKMKEEFAADRLRKILPQGGEGTLKKYYRGYEKYIYAKTGGLESDVVSLSGYLDTKKGHSVTFSFVVNNHRGTRDSAHKAIEQVLTYIVSYY